MPTVVYKPTLTMMGVESLVPVIQMYQPARRNAVRVQVKRGDTWHDITSRVHRGQVRHNNDDPIALLDLTLLNGTEYDSLAPRVKTSPLNRDDDDNYAPLLDRYNEILVEAAFSIDGESPTDYVPVFHGILGDSTTTEHDAEAGVVVHLQARDLAKRLQDDLIREPITYRDMYASQIIQALLDERFGEGTITLNGLGVDDFYIDEVTFEYVDTWQAIQSFCEQSDKDVRYMLDEGTGEFLLTYWTPSLTMTPVWSISASDIIRESLETSDASLRHAVEVRYIDASGERQSEYVEDTTNQKPNEPLRVALIEEGDTSAIRDQAAALRFANAVLSALKTEPATDSLQVPFTPYMRIYDVIQVANTGVRSEPELYAIDELRLNFSADEWWTEVVASESVKVRHEVWLEKEAKRGVKSPFTPGDLATKQKPPTPQNVNVRAGTGESVSIRWDPAPDGVFVEYGVYRSTTNDFSQAQKIGTVSGTRFVDANVDYDQTYYYWVTTINRSNIESDPTLSQSATPVRIGENDLAGAIFNIVPEATDLSGDPKPPDTGSLEALWDGDTTTGAAWSSGPVRVTFKYPMMWFFDMARLWSNTARSFYVEILDHDTDTWLQVLDQQTSEAGDWTVEEFDDGKMYATREVRVTFPGSSPVDLRELKFWTITLADEILAQRLRLTGEMWIESQDGRAIVGPLPSGGYGFSAQNAAGDRSELTEGRLAFFLAGQDTPFYYVRHVEYGISDIGVPVVFSHPFNSPPMVLIMASEMQVYDATIGGDQIWRLGAEDITTTGFVARATLEAKGGTGSEPQDYVKTVPTSTSPQVLMSSADPEYATRYTGFLETTSMLFTFSVKYGDSSTSRSLHVWIDYREENDANWVQAYHENIVADGTGVVKNVQVSSLNGRYEWRLRVENWLGISGFTVTMLNWEWSGNPIITQSGRVQWIAIENPSSG